MEVRPLTALEYLQVQARKQRDHKPKPPMVEPDTICYAHERPKAAFYTEEKAQEALIITQQRREIEGNPQVEKRFYRCVASPGESRVREDHFHLTSMSPEDFDRKIREGETDVHQD